MAKRRGKAARRCLQGPASTVRLPGGFVPSSARKDSPHKFSNPAEPGVLVGYHQRPGGRWSSDYLVHRLSDLDVPLEDLNVLMPVHRTREVFHVLGKPHTFPLKPRYDAAKTTLGVVDRGAETGGASWDVPAPLPDKEADVQETAAEAPCEGTEDKSSLPFGGVIENSARDAGRAVGSLWLSHRRATPTATASLCESASPHGPRASALRCGEP